MKRNTPTDFWKYVDRGLAQDCWSWVGSVGAYGHGQFRIAGEMEKAHRFSYELLVGPIPKAMHLHHTCGNARCVNPSHLELLSRREHATVHRVKNTCINGHSLGDPSNVYLRNGVRHCRSCRRDNSRRRYLLTKERAVRTSKT